MQKSSLPQKALYWLLAIAILSVLWTSTAFAENSKSQRFVDHGDGTISDTQTGFMWMKKDSYLHSGHWLNWFEAFDFIKALNEEYFAGYTDWRMPTTDELTTLYEEDKINSSQVGHEMVIHIDPVFAKNGSGSIWSSQQNGRYNAFGVVFNTGDRFNSSKKSRGRKAVRAVRNIKP